MARRRGTIDTRAKDRHICRIYLGKDSKGKRIYSSRTVHGTYQDAQKKLAKMVHESDRGTFVEVSKMTLSEYLEGWLDRKEGTVSPTTMRDYRSRMSNDIDPYIGGTRLDKVSPEQLERLYNKLFNGTRDLSERTVRYTHTVLRQALKSAVRKGHLARNPCDFVEHMPRASRKVRNEKQELDVFDRQQTKDFLAWAETSSEHWALWTLFLTTGLRPQEALALKWDDILDGKLTVRRALNGDGSGGFVIGAPKTRESARTITLPLSTVNALEAHRAQQVEDMVDNGPMFPRVEWCFCNSKGGFWDTSRIRKYWKRDLKRAKKSGLEIPEIRLYDTRHTHATHLLSAGVNPKVVADRLGHSTIKITLDTYSRVLPKQEEKTAEVIEETLFGKPELAVA